jgi:hypothetical protein
MRACAACDSSIILTLCVNKASSACRRPCTGWPHGWCSWRASARHQLRQQARGSGGPQHRWPGTLAHARGCSLARTPGCCTLSPSLTPEAPTVLAAGCRVAVTAWRQCGGTDNCPRNTTNCDAQWPGHCCPAGTLCWREGRTWWRCRCAGQGAAASALPATTGRSAEALECCASAMAHYPDCICDPRRACVVCCWHGLQDAAPVSTPAAPVTLPVPQLHRAWQVRAAVRRRHGKVSGKAAGECSSSSSMEDCCWHHGAAVARWPRH